jgi:hypothetical protein
VNETASTETLAISYTFYTYIILKSANGGYVYTIYHHASSGLKTMGRPNLGWSVNISAGECTCFRESVKENFCRIMAITDFASNIAKF